MRATAITAAVALLTAACISTRPSPTSQSAPSAHPSAQMPAPPGTATPGQAAPELANDAAAGGAAWLPEILRPVTLPSVDPLEAARLAENELVTLPTRAAPIERWKARRYFCLADFNRDDAIDEEDTRTFLEAFTTREGPFAEFLDLNRDGVVDQSDMDVMLHAAESTCDPSLVARNRDVSC